LSPLLALLACTPISASAATDSISAVVQVCILPSGPSCDPTQPINGADWAALSTTVYGSQVWWRVVVTNTGTDPLTNISVSSSLPNSGSSPTDCEGSVPVPGNSLAAGASYGYECQTTNVIPPTTLTQTVTASGDPPSGPPVTSTTSAPAIVQPPFGYWLVGSDGGIFSFGSAGFHGSMGGIQLQRPVVGIVSTADHEGYWLEASDGGVFTFGDIQFYGSIPGLGLHPAGSGLPNSLKAPIVGMVPSRDQGGYFMVASDGGVFAFGDAHFGGSCPGIGGCSGAAVAVVPDASGTGYWLITESGNVYTFADAPYLGAPGPQSSPITSAVPTPDGHGYWILDAGGQVFAYGDATPLGNAPAGATGGLNPASAIFSTSGGGGYWIADALGKVFTLGDAPNDGDMSGSHLNGPIIAASGS
jgi:uncharacterized repeat protein (TIGR01451 family)